jgi:hypothetical protein
MVWDMLNTPSERERRPWLFDEIFRQVILVPLLLLVNVVLLVALLISVLSRDALHHSLSFTPDEIYLSEPVCPGTQIDLDRDLHVAEPLAVDVYGSVANADTGETVISLERTELMQPRPSAAVIAANLNWTVADLPPGNFVQITAAVAEGTHAAFSHLYFTVPPYCGSGGL